jgi:CheY-like chemotaxis protein
MSKIETGKLELNPSEYDTPSLINDAVQLNVVRIGQKPIKFELEVDENLPSRIYGDELRLKQILNNLLSNAIKYTFEGRVKLSVKHSCIDGDNVFLHFIIEDTGQGMKPEDQARLFSEYLRFNSGTNRTTEGTGLGLNITKKLVLLMGGNIEAESEYGKGSKFTVSVKQKAIGDAIIGKDVAEHLRTFTFSDKKTDNDLCIIREEMPYGNVLVVDDVDTNLYVAQGLMAPYKLKAEMVESGFAAIDKVKAGNVYDIIFMDHMMPNMDGVETTEKIRGLGYTAPIVALTANALVGNDEIFAQKGFDGFISKPIDIRQLNMILNKFIRDRHREEAKKYKPQAVAQSEEPTISAGLLKVFCRDAEKVIVTLHQALADGNTKLFAITAHAIKSALANIGENEAAQQAFMLEKAGLDKDMEFINGNTKNFTEILQALIKKLVPANDNPAAEEADIEEDKTLLAQQLDIIKTACEDYDDSKVYAALDLLKEKQWKRATCDVIESIHEALYLCSDFEEAAKLSEMLRKGI